MSGGLILVDKPAGWSSRYITNKVMKALGYAKAGHNGTLDKMASGMLPICLDEATKFASFITDSDKQYSLKALFGYKSTTGDIEGACQARSNKFITKSELQTGLNSFIGEIEQTPPMYSAIKHKGVPLYKYARSGVEIERVARPVTVHAIELTSYSWPWVELRVRCSKGTYIRSLIEDIAESLQAYAYLVALRRDWVQGFSEQRMYDLEDIKANSKNINLLTFNQMLPKMPEIILDFDYKQRFLHGQKLSGFSLADGVYKIICQDSFLGVASLSGGVLAPKRLLKSSALN